MDIITKYFRDLTQGQMEQFAALKDLYTNWNQKINVISRKDMDNFYVHHVLHSLAIARVFYFPAGYNIIDLGSGGGFPGIPLAILFPGVSFCLVDSIRKKMTVATEIAQAIGLRNVTVQAVRAEEMRGKHFDVVLSRAVAPLKDLWIWSNALLTSTSASGSDEVHGLICLKGGDLNEEIAQSGCRPQIHNIDTMFDEAYFKEKYVVYVRKKV